MEKTLIHLLEDNGTGNGEVLRYLTQHGFKVMRSGLTPEDHQLSRGTKPDLAIIFSNQDDGWQALETARLLRLQNHGTPVILIVQESSETRAVAALRAGINDYFTWPVSSEELLASIRRHLREARGDKPAVPKEDPEASLIGETPVFRKIKDYVLRAAATDCNVLITGETGTGKEKVAEMIHRYSARRDKPMVCINCAALPENLLESELFGYERGAFTGANNPYPGKLRMAEGGTVFLDEIFEMSSHMQAKLLRALDSRSIYSLGGRTPIPLNIRIVAATNQNPERAIEQGVLRQDLFFRLNVARVHLPPLRERKMDIPLLLEHFLEEMNQRYDRQVESFSPEVMELLLGYVWPGNIRELRNLVEALFINLPARVVSMVHLPESFQRLKENLERPQGEREQLLAALMATNWNKSQAAENLHISRMTLYRKMEKYEINTSHMEPNLSQVNVYN
jgi:DNA-binding NtrC family response regulator